LIYILIVSLHLIIELVRGELAGGEDYERASASATAMSSSGGAASTAIDLTTGTATATVETTRRHF
jgi:hypothetical protein